MIASKTITKATERRDSKREPGGHPLGLGCRVLKNKSLPMKKHAFHPGFKNSVSTKILE